MIMLNECEQWWASRAAQALDARLTNHVVAPSVNPGLVTEKIFYTTQNFPRHNKFNFTQTSIVVIFQ